MKQPFTILLAASQCWGALTFTAGGSNKVDHGSATGVDNLAAISVCAWIRPATLAANLYIWTKDVSAGGGFTRFVINDASGNMRFRIETNGGVAGNFTTNGAPLVVGVWSYVCATQAAAGGAGNIKIYHGTLSTLVTAAAGTATDLTVAKAADATSSLLIGGFSTTSSFSGRIAWAEMWDRALTLGEIQSLQHRPRVSAGCVLFTHYGFNGTSTQPDWCGTGNSGAVTGATESGHVPLGPTFGFDWKKLLRIPLYENSITNDLIFAD